MPNNKIVTLDKVAELTSGSANNIKNVLTYGQFDTLHAGHLRHLRQARSMGDTLIVALSPDGGGGGKAATMPEALRAEALAHLDFVDIVCIGAPGLRSVLRSLRPDVCAVMPEGTGDEPPADVEALCDEMGLRFAETEVVLFDSTVDINRFLSGFGEEVRQYLDQFRSRFSLTDLENALDAMGSLRVAVVGDTIIDEYSYCSPLGTSSKDPILALRYQSNDIFAGGILAVANHVANFAKEVGLFTVLGERNSYREFIDSKLDARVKPHYAVQAGAPTVRKRRYVDGYTQNKILEIYHMEDLGLTPEADAEFRQILLREMPGYDIVLVADFGHGAISPETRALLSGQPGFLAVNAQANSGNRGFHTITKFKRADFVSIAEHEVRLEMRDMRGSVRQMLDVLGPRLSCGNFVVTRGKRGSIIRSADGRLTEVPAFAKKVVDRIGAGDAFLSVTAMAAKLGTPPELICFIGNIVGALAVEILGNQKSIDKASVKQYAASLLG